MMIVEVSLPVGFDSMSARAAIISLWSMDGEELKVKSPVASWSRNENLSGGTKTGGVEINKQV